MNQLQLLVTFSIEYGE